MIQCSSCKELENIRDYEAFHKREKRTLGMLEGATVTMETAFSPRGLLRICI